ALEPQAAGGAGEERETLREPPPDQPPDLLNRSAVASRDAQVLHAYALAVEHAEDVVVGHDQQVGRRGEARGRICEQAPMDVSVRTDQRQTGNTVVELPRHAP